MAVGQVSFHSDKRVRSVGSHVISNYNQHHVVCQVKRGIHFVAFVASASLNVRPVHVETRQNPVVNRLNKTKVEKQVDHEQERIDRIKAENAIKRAAAAAKVRRLRVCQSVQIIWLCDIETSGYSTGTRPRSRESCTLLWFTVQRRNRRGCWCTKKNG